MHADILWDARPIQLDLNTLLKFEATTRRRLPAFFVILMLTFAVSSWGLQYKLSLYHTPGVHHSVPEAKLLSQKERPTSSSQMERLQLSHRPFPVATHTPTPDSFAALPLHMGLLALQDPEEDVLAKSAFALRSRYVSRIGLRAPPTA